MYMLFVLYIHVYMYMYIVVIDVVRNVTAMPSD